MENFVNANLLWFALVERMGIFASTNNIINIYPIFIEFFHFTSLLSDYNLFYICC